MDPETKNIESEKVDATSTPSPYSETPTSNIDSPVSYSPDVLGNGEQLLDIPDVPPDTTYEGAAGQFEGLAAENDAYIKSLEAERNSAAQSTGTSFDQYLTAIAEGKDVETLTFEAEQEAGVPELEKELNRLNAELMTEQRALKKKVDALNANLGGGLASGVAGEIANAQRESYSKQADIAVVQMAAQGRYDSAIKWAQRKANIMFAADERKINVREKIYNANKSYFDKLDERAFSAKTDDLKRKLEEERRDFEILQQVKLDALKMAQTNGAPVSVLSAIQGAETPQEVLMSGGKYASTDLLQREQLRASIASSWASYDLDTLKLNQEKQKIEQLNQAIEDGAIILDESQQDMAFKLGKEYESESAEFKKQVGAYNRIIASAEEPSAAGDLALIFNYMKMLDPGSTVREGEFANAQNSAGVPSQIIARYNAVLNGQRLADEQRTDFVDRSTKIYNTSLDQQIELENRYRDKAVNIFGLPGNAADYVIQDIRAVGTTSEIAVSSMMENLSVEQMEMLINEGLLPASTNSQ